MKRHLLILLALCAALCAPAQALARDRAGDISDRLTTVHSHVDRASDHSDRLRLPNAHTAAGPVLGSPIPASSDPPSAAHPLYGVAADGLNSYNVVSSPAKFEQLVGGSVLRIIVNPGNTPSETPQAVRFVRTAEAEGYRISLVIQWPDWWKLPTVESFYRMVLRHYGPLRPWAVSVGNEQELGYGHSFSPADYSAAWRILAPMIRRALPRTILVAGEVSPWGYQWLVQALALGLPGMQAIAGHPYHIRYWFSVVGFVALAHRYHVQPWVTEGSSGPDAWPDCAFNSGLGAAFYYAHPCGGFHGDISRSFLAGHGLDVILEWLIGSRERGPTRVLPPPGKTT